MSAGHPGSRDGGRKTGILAATHTHTHNLPPRIGAGVGPVGLGRQRDTIIDNKGGGKGGGACSCCFPFPENKKNLELPRANRDQPVTPEGPKGSFRFETNVLAEVCAPT